jgi:hypothetical protein
MINLLNSFIIILFCWHVDRRIAKRRSGIRGGVEAEARSAKSKKKNISGRMRRKARRRLRRRRAERLLKKATRHDIKVATINTPVSRVGIKTLFLSLVRYQRMWKLNS